MKKANRWFGVKRIANALHRLFFLPGSPETVRQRLHEAGLIDRPAKARRNLTRPRFFERATPNQMWQSDLFTFRLGGKYAYVVAFMDDYSRFIVGLDLYRSPTAEAVIETYCTASTDIGIAGMTVNTNGQMRRAPAGEWALISFLADR